MKRFIVFGMLVFLAIAVCAGPEVKILTGDNLISAKVKFAPCEITAFNEKYQQASVLSLTTLNCAGNPALPFYPCQILLPPNREVKEVTVSGEGQVIDGHYRIKPAATPIPWFAKNRGKQAVEREAYKNPEFFPGRLVSQWRSTPLAGYRIIGFNIYPLQHNPLSGELKYYPELEIKIELVPTRDTTVARKDYRDRVCSLVANPEDAKRYQKREYVAAVENDFPYVIITSQNLLGLNAEYSFERFVDFLGSSGVNACIVSVEEIYRDYPGKDRAEKVRNFIKHAFSNWNTRYVLLGGDADKGNETVPVRRFKTDIHYVYMDGSSLTVHEMMASDYYYCALDGNFDGNGNGYYGEPGDDIDLEAEVVVGRAPVDNEKQVNNFVKKTIQAYRYAQDATDPKVLMLGEHLFSPGQCGVKHHIYGASFMDELLNGSNTHGFYTHGFSNRWGVAKLYDKGSWGGWSSSDIKRELNNFGACWVNHIGHSSPAYNARLYRSSMSSLSNKIPFLYCTQGCNAGRFTNERTAPFSRGGEAENRGDDCISEYMIHSDHGAFAVISNWSYGLSPEDPETSAGDAPGANQYFHRLMVDAFFDPALKIHRIGDMLGYARLRMNPWLLDSKMQTQTVRWVYYEFNLLGDPHAPLPKID